MNKPEENMSKLSEIEMRARWDIDNMHPIHDDIALLIRAVRQLSNLALKKAGLGPMEWREWLDPDVMEFVK